MHKAAAVFPRSFAKVQRMARVVIEEQFVSFICRGASVSSANVLVGTARRSRGEPRRSGGNIPRLHRTKRFPTS
jgi:hypothetical protein